jgi:hypothetical protein
LDRVGIGASPGGWRNGVARDRAARRRSMLNFKIRTAPEMPPEVRAKIQRADTKSAERSEDVLGGVLIPQDFSIMGAILHRRISAYIRASKVILLSIFTSFFIYIKHVFWPGQIIALGHRFYLRIKNNIVQFNNIDYIIGNLSINEINLVLEKAITVYEEKIKVSIYLDCAFIEISPTERKFFISVTCRADRDTEFISDFQLYEFIENMKLSFPTSIYTRS